MVSDGGRGPQPDRRQQRWERRQQWERRPRLEPGQPQRGRAGQPVSADEERFGLAVFSYLITGMAIYGAIGWFAGRWAHLPVLFPIGMVAGLGFAIALVIFRLRAR